MSTEDHRKPAHHYDNMTTAAAVLAAATAIYWAVLALLDHQGAWWLAFPVLGAATIVTALLAGGHSPKNNWSAFVSLLIGVLAVTVFVVFVVFDS